jgi:hypothetical protein
LIAQFNYVGDKQVSGVIVCECLWGGMSTAVADFAYKPLLDEVIVYIYGVADGEKIQMPNLGGLFRKESLVVYTWLYMMSLNVCCKKIQG